MRVIAQDADGNKIDRDTGKIVQRWNPQTNQHDPEEPEQSPSPERPVLKAAPTNAAPALPAIPPVQQPPAPAGFAAGLYSHDNNPIYYDGSKHQVLGSWDEAYAKHGRNFKGLSNDEFAQMQRGGGSAPAMSSIPPAGFTGGAPTRAAPLTTSSFGPGNDLRATQVNPAETSYNPVQQQAIELINGAAIGNFRSVGTPDFSGSREAIAGANVDPFRTVAGPDFSKAIGTLERSEGELGGAQVGDLRQIAAGSYQTSPEALRARQIATQILEQIGSAPNRTAIAKEKLDIFNERNRKPFEENLRLTGQANAALGRLGSGMLRDDLREAVVDSSKERDLLARELAAETAGLELSDTFGKLNAGLSAGGQFRTEDLNDANMHLRLREEDRGERNTQAARESEKAGLALARSSALERISGQRGGFESTRHAADVYERDAGASHSFGRADLGIRKAAALSDITGAEHAAKTYERDVELDHGRATGEFALRKAGGLAGIDESAFGQGLTRREEVRGERGYQQGMAQQALENNRVGALLEDQITNNRVGRQMDYIRTLMAGGAYDPTGVYGGAAGAAGQNASGAIDAATQIAMLDAYRRRMEQGSGGTAGGVSVADPVFGGFA